MILCRQISKLLEFASSMELASAGLELVEVIGPSLDPSKVWYAIPNNLMPNGRKEDFLNCDIATIFPKEILEVDITKVTTTNGKRVNTGPRKKDSVVITTTFGLLARSLRMKNLQSNKFLK